MVINLRAEKMPRQCLKELVTHTSIVTAAGEGRAVPLLEVKNKGGENKENLGGDS